MFVETKCIRGYTVNGKFGKPAQVMQLKISNGCTKRPEGTNSCAELHQRNEPLWQIESRQPGDKGLRGEKTLKSQQTERGIHMNKANGESRHLDWLFS